MPYTDSFDFISTRLDPQKSIFTDDPVKFLPTIPADFRPNSLESQVNKTNPESVFEQLGQRLNNLPNNLPAYQYTTQQEKRYDNPYLQYTPSNVMGTDTEDVYGRFQGAGEQLFNSLVKFGANAAGTFASSFLTIPATLDLVRQGKYIEAYEEDSLFSGIQDALIALEDKFPNYYTSLERNRTDWINAFSPTGAMNFWGDKVVKNIGFSLGGLASGLVVDAAIELGSAGTATPVTFIAAANQFQKFYKNLFRGFRNLVKGSDQIDNIIDATRVTNSLSKGLEVSNLSRLGTLGRTAAVTYLGAQGESFIEGYHTYIDTKKQLLEEALQRGELDSETLSEIEQRSQDAGRYTSGLNIPILTLSNLLQFPNLLAGKSMLAATNNFIKMELGEQGLKAISDYSTKKAVKEWAKESFKDIVTEGFEEGAQYHISNSLHDYYVDRVNPKIKQPLFNFLLDNIPDTLTDEQFWSEAGIGALTGFLMGAPATIPHITSGKKRTDDLVNLLNTEGGALQRFNSLAKQYSSNINLNLSETERDQQISAHDALFSTVHDSLKYGTYDVLLDSLGDLKDLDVQDYNKAFGTEFETNVEKDIHLNSIVQEAQQIKQDVLKVNQFYPKNPYSKPYLINKIKKALSPKSETELNNIQENLFNDYKEVVARNESMLRKTKGQILKHKDTLKTFGVKDEALAFVANLSSRKQGFKTYVDWKKAQIKDLKRQVDYYTKLSQSDNTLVPEIKPKEELKKYEQLLERTEKYLETAVELFNKTQSDPKDEKLRNLLNALVLLEETTEEDRSRFQKNREEELKKLQQIEKDKDSLEDENNDLNSDNSKTQEQLVDIQQQTAEEAIPHSEVTTVPEPIIDPNAWLNEYNIGDKTPKGLLITSKAEDHLVGQDDLGNSYKITKQGDKFITEPLGLTGLIEPELSPATLEEPLIEPVPPEVEPAMSEIEVAEPDLIGLQYQNEDGRIYTIRGITEKGGIQFTTSDGAKGVWNKDKFNSYVSEGRLKLIEEDLDLNTITKVTPKLTLGEQEFTKEEIFNYPGTVWIKSGSSMVNATKVYSVEKNGVKQRELSGTTTELEVSKKGSRIVAKTPEEMNTFYVGDSTFKQVIRPNEKPILRAEVETDVTNKEKDLLNFLGDYQHMKDIFQQQINRGKIELIC